MWCLIFAESEARGTYRGVSTSTYLKSAKTHKMGLKSRSMMAGIVKLKQLIYAATCKKYKLAGTKSTDTIKI